MYPSLLILHSWLRWFALAGIVVVFVRALLGALTNVPWLPADTKWMKGAAHVLTVQLAIGILLYAVSPFIRGLLENMSATMQDRTTRLFAIEHGVVMLLALGAMHMGAALSRKAATDTAKHARVAITFGIALLLIGYAIPWMRPMFRIGM